VNITKAAINNILSRLKTLSLGVIDSEKIVFWNESNTVKAGVCSSIGKVITTITSEADESLDSRHVVINMSKLSAILSSIREENIVIKFLSKSARVSSNTQQYSIQTHNLTETQSKMTQDIDVDEMHMTHIGPISSSVIKTLGKAIEGTRTMTKDREYKIMLSFGDKQVISVVNGGHIISTAKIEDDNMTVPFTLETISMSLPNVLTAFAKLECNSIDVWLSEDKLRVASPSETVIVSFRSIPNTKGRDMLTKLESFLNKEVASISLPASTMLREVTSMSPIVSSNNDNVKLVPKEDNTLGVVVETHQGSYASLVNKGYIHTGEETVIAMTPTMMQRISKVALDTDSSKEVKMKIYALNDIFSFCYVDINTSRESDKLGFVFKFRCQRAPDPKNVATPESTPS